MGAAAELVRARAACVWCKYYLLELVHRVPVCLCRVRVFALGNSGKTAAPQILTPFPFFAKAERPALSERLDEKKS